MLYGPNPIGYNKRVSNYLEARIIKCFNRTISKITFQSSGNTSDDFILYGFATKGSMIMT